MDGLSLASSVSISAYKTVQRIQSRWLTCLPLTKSPPAASASLPVPRRPPDRSPCLRAAADPALGTIAAHCPQTAITIEWPTRTLFYLDCSSSQSFPERVPHGGVVQYPRTTWFQIKFKSSRYQFIYKWNTNELTTRNTTQFNARDASVSSSPPADPGQIMLY
ncbi:hypothetical protein E2C01_010426 [Portunus trituberculatus]|uniref:Uncharacterized protein n=1 Tax=Portunus trituberculatus TaxID=210409 RepID=A0A5B7D8F5_PORTR|nr:hypothetical protein [Portunus trituberculatus]